MVRGMPTVIGERVFIRKSLDTNDLPRQLLSRRNDGFKPANMARTGDPGKRL